MVGVWVRGFGLGPNPSQGPRSIKRTSAPTLSSNKRVWGLEFKCCLGFRFYAPTSALTRIHIRGVAEGRLGQGVGDPKP